MVTSQPGLIAPQPGLLVGKQPGPDSCVFTPSIDCFPKSSPVPQALLGILPAPVSNADRTSEIAQQL